jgi:N-methylhydantoinase A
MLNMEVGRNFARSLLLRKAFLNLDRVNQLFDEMQEEARQVLGEIGIAPEHTTLRRSIEMRYLGQFHEVDVLDIPAGKLGAAEIDQIIEAFHRRHKALFTFDMPKREVEFLNLQLKATLRHEPLKLAEIESASGGAEKAIKRRRPILWKLSKGYQETAVYDGDRLAAATASTPGDRRRSRHHQVIPPTTSARWIKSKLHFTRRSQDDAAAEYPSMSVAPSPIASCSVKKAN